MSNKHFLDLTGLGYFYNKLKSVFFSKSTGEAHVSNTNIHVTAANKTTWNNKTTIEWDILGDGVLTNLSSITLENTPTNNSNNLVTSGGVKAAIPTKVSDLTNDSGFTTNTGTITGITMNGVSKGTSGVVNLGTVITSHQDISGKEDKSNKVTSISSSSTDTQYPSAKCVYDNVNSAFSKIPYGVVDSTSTATVFTATVPGITALEDGTCVMLRNSVVTSASGFTLNINGLGAHHTFSNMTLATAETTIFNINYTMLFVYCADVTVSSIKGAWCCYRGYDANTNTIGYQVRTNSSVRTVTDTARYYKLYFTSADTQQWVPASVNSTNNVTTARTPNQRPIDPFGPIVYTSANTNYATGANLAATTIWQQYAMNLGYSFGPLATSMTSNKPVYLKCAPQSDGSAIIDSTTPIVQALPSTEDGKIYIFLGIAYSATNIELNLAHPVYYYKDSAIRVWTNASDFEYAANIALTTSANYISEPEVKSIKINGSTTNSASSENAQIVYDNTNKCIKFVFN